MRAELIGAHARSVTYKRAHRFMQEQDNSDETGIIVYDQTDEVECCLALHPYLTHRYEDCADAN